MPNRKLIIQRRALRIYSFIRVERRRVNRGNLLDATTMFLNKEKMHNIFHWWSHYIIMLYINTRMYIVYYIGTNNVVVVLISLMSKASSEIPPRIV